MIAILLALALLRSPAPPSMPVCTGSYTISGLIRDARGRTYASYTVHSCISWEDVQQKAYAEEARLRAAMGRGGRRAR